MDCRSRCVRNDRDTVYQIFEKHIDVLKRDLIIKKNL
jgi:hypothetical protein